MGQLLDFQTAPRSGRHHTRTTITIGSSPLDAATAMMSSNIAAGMSWHIACLRNACTIGLAACFGLSLMADALQDVTPLTKR